jgi:uncharacterized membrane protein YGL010W
MYRFFCRQLAFYAHYHRDPRNCATHYLGMPMLFVAAILPLHALRFPLGSFQLPLTMALVAPAVVGWMALDLGVGMTLLLMLCPLFAAAELIANAGGPLVMWSAAIALFLVGWLLQLVGHTVFERRRPAFVDDLSQALIGPMFVVSKMLVKLGMRRDLASLLAEECSTAPHRRESTPQRGRATN